MKLKSKMLNTDSMDTRTLTTWMHENRDRIDFKINIHGHRYK